MFQIPFYAAEAAIADYEREVRKHMDHAAARRIVKEEARLKDNPPLPAGFRGRLTFLRRGTDPAQSR